MWVNFYQPMDEFQEPEDGQGAAEKMEGTEGIR